jgi:hypothetical protein
VIHYRALNGPLDSLTSDAPLVLFYRLEPRAGGAALEYHLIYSYEDAGTDLTGLLAVRGAWYTSAWGRPDLAFAEPDAESTAVKVPAGTTEAEVTGIALRAFDPPAEPADVRLVRAFFLDGAYRPRPPFAGGAACRLTRREPRRVVWERP